jgi:multidrug efflux pump subunit AcrA (membrane-fusion protein)
MKSANRIMIPLPVPSNKLTGRKAVTSYHTDVPGKILIAMLALLALMSSCKEKQQQTYKIEKGKFRQTFVETGELAAINTKTFVMPRYGRYYYEMKIIGLLDHGAEVKAGDSILQLDPSEVNKVIVELETQLETEQANLEKLLVNQKNSESEVETRLKTEEATFNLRKLSMEYSRFESEKTKKIRDLEFQQAKINYENVKRSIKLKQIVDKNDLKIQKIRVRQLKDDIKSSKDVIPKLTIRTPIPGIFQIGTSRRNGTMLKIGDEVYQGNNLGSVPDLRWMKVNTTVNEQDFFKIETGQRVIVRLDALPEVSFTGEIVAIGKLCHLKDDKSKQKVFDVEVNILVSDKRLKPGMTVNTEFICKQLNNVLYVPLNCIENDGTGDFIFIKKGGSIERTEVDAGPANNSHIVVRGNIKENDVIVPVSQIETKNK